MKALERKYLAPYLIHDLKLNWSNGHYNFIITMEGVDKYGIDHNDIGYSGQPMTFTSFDDNIIKPILYPLSWLIREIEHNNEKFIPMEKLAKLAEIVNEKLEVKTRCLRRRHLKKDLIYFVTRKEGNQKIIVHIDVSKIELTPYWIIARLFEWHLDVLGLIPANLAIDKSTIK